MDKTLARLLAVRKKGLVTHAQYRAACDWLRAYAQDSGDRRHLSQFAAAHTPEKLRRLHHVAVMDDSSRVGYLLTAWVLSLGIRRTAPTPGS